MTPSLLSCSFTLRTDNRTVMGATNAAIQRAVTG